MRGGVEMLPEFMALLLGARNLYTSGFIAEVVRAGIRSVFERPARLPIRRAKARSDLRPCRHPQACA